MGSTTVLVSTICFLLVGSALCRPQWGDGINIGVHGNRNQVVGKVSGYYGTGGDQIGIGVNGHENQVIGKVSGPGNVIMHSIGKRQAEQKGDTIQIGVTGDNNQGVGKVTGGGSVFLTRNGNQHLFIPGGVFDGDLPGFSGDSLSIGIQGSGNQAVGKVEGSGKSGLDVQGMINSAFAGSMGQVTMTQDSGTATATGDGEATGQVVMQQGGGAATAAGGGDGSAQVVMQSGAGEASQSGATNQVIMQATGDATVDSETGTVVGDAAQVVLL